MEEGVRIQDAGEFIFEDKYSEPIIVGLSENDIFIIILFFTIYMLVFPVKIALLLSALIAALYIIMYIFTTVKYYDRPTFQIYERGIYQISPPTFIFWDKVEKVELVWISIVGIDSKRGVDLKITLKGGKVEYIPTNLGKDEREKVIKLLKKSTPKTDTDIKNQLT